MLTARTSHPAGRGRADSPARPESAVRPDRAADESPPGRHLFGRLEREGFRITWFDFNADTAVDLSRVLVPDTVEICLNLDGEGCLETNGDRVEYGQMSAGFYCVGDPELTMIRQDARRHRFAVVAFARAHLEQELSRQLEATHPLIREVLDSPRLRSRLGPIQPLTPAQRQLALGLSTPPVADAALGLWHRCKAHELMAQFFFRTVPGENFCTRQNRLADERVHRVIAVLRESLTQPPSLKELGRRVGCSPFYLSRTFSRHTGLTIPQYLRHLRMHRAAELLRGGLCNVTEAAMEVGYSSLSHFSVAFHETFGCCPGLYPWGAKETCLPPAGD